jgi:hypothetical protein
LKERNSVGICSRAQHSNGHREPFPVWKGQGIPIPDLYCSRTRGSRKGQRIIGDFSAGGQSGRGFYGADLGITCRDN